MSKTDHLLLLAGSFEAREIAAQLAAQGRRVTASLATDGHWSGDLAVPTRIGGFGGAEGFHAFLREAGVTAVLDATHPYAAKISARSWAVCQAAGLPYLQIDRPGWTAGPGDQWRHVPTAKHALSQTKPGQRLFVATGRESLSVFEAAQDRVVFFRRLTQAPEPSSAPHITMVPGEGPFTVAGERALFQKLNIDVVMCKNAGGALSRTKLDAARLLGLPVILLDRPPATGAPLVHTVEEALTWVRQL